MNNIISSERKLVTPSIYAKTHYLYVQEAGSLQSYSPHISARKDLESILFLVVTEGSGRLIYEGNEITLASGDCAFIDCRKSYSHESSADHPWRLQWVHFYGSDAEHFINAYSDQNLSTVFHPGNPSVFINLLSQIFKNCASQGFAAELETHRLLTDLLAMIFMTHSQSQGAAETQGKLYQIRDYMESHLSERITLESLAKLFYISKYHLSREYHRIFGETLINDLNTLRISHAKSQLRFSDAPVEEIANSCGYSDSAYFVHVFRQAEGITPLQYRKQWRG